MKTLTTKAQRRDAQTFRLTGVGPSLMKTSVLIATSTQAEGRSSFHRHVRRLTDCRKLHLLKAEADMLGWGWGGGDGLLDQDKNVGSVISFARFQK